MGGWMCMDGGSDLERQGLCGARWAWIAGPGNYRSTSKHEDGKQQGSSRAGGGQGGAHKADRRGGGGCGCATTAMSRTQNGGST